MIGCDVAPQRSTPTWEAGKAGPLAALVSRCAGLGWTHRGPPQLPGRFWSLDAPSAGPVAASTATARATAPQLQLHAARRMLHAVHTGRKHHQAPSTSKHQAPPSTKHLQASSTKHHAPRTLARQGTPMTGPGSLTPTHLNLR
ncbi:hypothetical protein VDGL01_08792 [Verticillium dahliae]